MWKRVQRTFEKNRNDLFGILCRQYPAFVLSDHEQEMTSIPTFVFHDVIAEALDPMFEFLAENRYVTLTADDYVERKVRGQGGVEREVLLTFDDGHKSLYAVAYPALKRYGLKAVAYIVPGMTPEREGEDRRESLERSLCNWQEVREMHESGFLDIQSHSMYHHSIAISDRLMDFVRPNLKYSFLEADLAPITEREGSNNALKPALGTPIYDWGARYDTAPAFQESPAVVVACCQYVQDHGGPRFFETQNWRGRLKSVWAAARGESDSARLEDAKEQRAAILKDFIDSKNEIERRLPGKLVRHFCFPWFRGAPLSMRLSAEAGYVSNAWGSLLPKFVRKSCAPITIPRLSPTYVWRLPGKGRKSRSEVLRKRFFQQVS
jgi:Polysaccharide deacetylase